MKSFITIVLLLGLAGCLVDPYDNNLPEPEIIDETQEIDDIMIEDNEETVKIIEEVEETIDETVEEVEEIIDEPEDVIVLTLTSSGFDRTDITINQGQTVRFVNQRQINALTTASLTGNYACNKVKSGTLKFGESYEYTFFKPTKCQVLDVIVSSAIVKITVQP